MEVTYAIVDIETTGGNFYYDKIIEIGIVLYKDGQVIKELESLINPKRNIPMRITQITGISNEMVKDAPCFYEVAKDIVEITENATFVAHNVNFDYTFIKLAFEELGFSFNREKLCTVVLSRRAFPQLPSCSLGNLIKYLGIEVTSRHRALEDARATVVVLDKILQMKKNDDDLASFLETGIKSSKLPRNIKLDFFETIPQKTGVYYFYNEYDMPIYIGKSINIKKRIIQHFGKTTKKSQDLQRQAHRIDFQVTESELAALLLESKEIKRYRPAINKAQRTRAYPFFIHKYYDDKGYICFGITKATKKNEKNKTIQGYYSSMSQARAFLRKLCHEYRLCEIKTGVAFNDEGTCNAFHVGICSGACFNIETPEKYNERVMKCSELVYQKFTEDFFLLDEGLEDDSMTIFLIQEGDFKGMGQVLKSANFNDIESLLEHIEYWKSNPEMNNIVKNYLLGQHKLKKVVFTS